ncbi:hypothetical protein F52700_7923 [Fusarium sp. NRRL 52700]|nr:hypothetical protein F52700_7923 [Fusarium sp. NRRL 52700]
MKLHKILVALWASTSSAAAGWCTDGEFIGQNNKWTITCGYVQTGGSVVWSTNENTLTDCINFCDTYTGCIGMTFDNMSGSCNLYSANGNLQAYSGGALAVIATASSSTSSSDTPSSSTSAAASTSSAAAWCTDQSYNDGAVAYLATTSSTSSTSTSDSPSTSTSDVFTTSSSDTPTSSTSSASSTSSSAAACPTSYYTGSQATWEILCDSKVTGSTMSSTPGMASVEACAALCDTTALCTGANFYTSGNSVIILIILNIFNANILDVSINIELSCSLSNQLLHRLANDVGNPIIFVIIFDGININNNLDGINLGVIGSSNINILFDFSIIRNSNVNLFNLFFYNLFFYNLFRNVFFSILVSILVSSLFNRFFDILNFNVFSIFFSLRVIRKSNVNLINLLNLLDLLNLFHVFFNKLANVINIINNFFNILHIFKLSIIRNSNINLFNIFRIIIIIIFFLNIFRVINKLHIIRIINNPGILNLSIRNSSLNINSNFFIIYCQFLGTLNVFDTLRIVIITIATINCLNISNSSNLIRGVVGGNFNIPHFIISNIVNLRDYHIYLTYLIYNIHYIELHNRNYISLIEDSSTPSNAPIVQGYAYDGCLGSRDNYPSFTLVATESDMTVQKCIEMSPGSKYVGLYEQSCYKADSLDRTEFVSSRFFFFFFFFSLFLFAFFPASHIFFVNYPYYLLAVLFLHLRLFIFCQTRSASSFESIARTSQPPSLTHLPTIEPIRTIHVTKDITMTVYTETTVTYVTVDTVNPGVTVTTCVSIDLLYIPCGCEEQVYPSVEMTTITCPCRACGSHGENTVTLTVPEAACQSTGYGYPLAQLPPGWIGGYETDNNGNRYVVAQPTSGLQKDFQPYFSIPVEGARISPPSNQATGMPAIPNGGSTEPSNNNQPPSAKGEGSHQGIPGSQHGTPQNPSQPEAAEGNHQGSDNSNGSGSETHTTPAPQPDVPGSHHGTPLNPSHPAAANGNQQGSNKSSGSGGEIVTTPAPQPDIPANTSGSHQGPGNESGNGSGSEASNGPGHGEPNNGGEGSENLTISEKETVTMSTSKPDMEVRPSGSGNQPEVASTLKTKTGGTSKEMNGPESTKTLSASGSEESGKSPLTVSEANGNRDMPWTVIAGVLITGIVLVF